jgi:enterobactin synthetase component D / holo-[acyl-carrier protein] synthase
MNYPPQKTLIAEILPPFVAAAEVMGGTSDATLSPEEAAALGNVSPVRREEFALGRTCARRALAGLGVSPAPILVGSHREPIWPASVVGSITHCERYCAAVVGRKDQVVAIGIDADENAALPRGVVTRITIDEERQRLQSGRGTDGIHWDRALFIAKESVYKAWFTVAACWLNFEDVLITFDPDRETFHAQLRVAGPAVHGRPIDSFEGRFLSKQGLIIAAVVLRKDSTSG